MAALRDHLSRSDRPLQSLAAVARDLESAIGSAARRCEGDDRRAMENLATGFATAVERIWRDLGGDPGKAPPLDLTPG